MILSKDSTDSGGIFWLDCKSEIKVALGMDSIFCRTSKSNSNVGGWREGRLKYQTGLGQCYLFN